MAAANKGSKAKAGGVRFAPSQPAEGAPGHVHFEEKLRDSAVMVTQEKDGHFLVKVGFLKILHKYEITFLLPPSQRLGKDVCAVPLPNLNLRVLSVTSVPEGYSIKCEYTAHKEGVLKEEMLLASETGDGACLKTGTTARRCSWTGCAASERSWSTTRSRATGTALTSPQPAFFPGAELLFKTEKATRPPSPASAGPRPSCCHGAGGCRCSPLPAEPGPLHPHPPCASAPPGSGWGRPPQNPQRLLKCPSSSCQSSAPRVGLGRGRVSLAARLLLLLLSPSLFSPPSSPGGDVWGLGVADPELGPPSG